MMNLKFRQALRTIVTAMILGSGVMATATQAATTSKSVTDAAVETRESDPLAMSEVLQTSWGWRGVWLMASVCVLFSIYAMDRFYAAVQVLEAGLDAEPQPQKSMARVINEDDDPRKPLLGGPELQANPASRPHVMS